ATIDEHQPVPVLALSPLRCKGLGRGGAGGRKGGLLERGQRRVPPVFLLGRRPAFVGEALDGTLAQGREPRDAGARQTLLAVREIGQPGLCSAHADAPTPVVFCSAASSLTQP